MGTGKAFTTEPDVVYYEAVVSDVTELLSLTPNRIEIPRDKKWESFRNRMVAAHPFCKICKTKSRLQAHHKKPFHLWRSLELVDDNIVILCVRCHLVYGHLLNWESFCYFIDRLIESIENRPLDVNGWLRLEEFCKGGAAHEDL